MRYFTGFLLSIGLIALVFILVLRGLSGDPAVKEQPPMTNYANTASVVRLTVDGRITSEQEHRAYRITVGRDETRIETLKGYEYELLEQRSFANNRESYYNFLRALDAAGFDKGNSKAEDEEKDERGLCAAGKRYIMEIITGSSTVQRYWTADCGGMGTFKGERAEVRRLFNTQVPPKDYSQITRSIRM